MIILKIKNMIILNIKNQEYDNTQYQSYDNTQYQYDNTQYQTQDTQWNPDFAREWEKQNPGFKVEDLSSNGAPTEIIDVNANDLRMRNWEMYDKMNKDMVNYNKSIRTSKTPISKGAKRTGHVSYLLQQASQNEHELFDLWTSGKNLRQKTRMKYGW